ncbi:MAG TPA: PIG-L family deacetylase [Candidatus Acidoferrales bacterium]|nr:PIG-L family deacetylase [Candidatus Acidoferrales bacterium]
MIQTTSTTKYDVVAFGAHPDDLEAVMGGTTVKLVRKGLSVLFVDLCDGEPARHAARGERHKQAVKAAEILGVERTTLTLQDRMISDTVEARLQVARVLRNHRPRIVLTTAGSGVHPDHKAVTELVTHGVFYARLPKWGEVTGGECLRDTDPHEIDRLFFGHCRMEPAWDRFDFATDVSDAYDVKMAALRVYESVFSGDQATLLDKYKAEDRYVGSLVGVEYAEAFRSRSPLLVDDPEVFFKTPFG